MSPLLFPLFPHPRGRHHPEPRGICKTVILYQAYNDKNGVIQEEANTISKTNRQRKLQMKVDLEVIQLMK
jgi:hypothetical protein